MASDQTATSHPTPTPTLDEEQIQINKVTTDQQTKPTDQPINSVSPKDDQPSTETPPFSKSQGEAQVVHPGDPPLAKLHNSVTAPVGKDSIPDSLTTATPEPEAVTESIEAEEKTVIAAAGNLQQEEPKMADTVESSLPTVEKVDEPQDVPPVEAAASAVEKESQDDTAVLLKEIDVPESVVPEREIQSDKKSQVIEPLAGGAAKNPEERSENVPVKESEAEVPLVKDREDSDVAETDKPQAVVSEVEVIQEGTSEVTKPIEKLEPIVETENLPGPQQAIPATESEAVVVKGEQVQEEVTQVTDKGFQEDVTKLIDEGVQEEVTKEADEAEGVVSDVEVKQDEKCEEVQEDVTKVKGGGVQEEVTKEADKADGVISDVEVKQDEKCEEVQEKVTQVIDDGVQEEVTKEADKAEEVVSDVEVKQHEKSEATKEVEKQEEAYAEAKAEEQPEVESKYETIEVKGIMEGETVEDNAADADKKVGDDEKISKKENTEVADKEVGEVKIRTQDEPPPITKEAQTVIKGEKGAQASEMAVATKEATHENNVVEVTSQEKEVKLEDVIEPIKTEGESIEKKEAADEEVAIPAKVEEETKKEVPNVPEVTEKPFEGEKLSEGAEPVVGKNTQETIQEETTTEANVEPKPEHVPATISESAKEVEHTEVEAKNKEEEQGTEKQEDIPVEREKAEELGKSESVEALEPLKDGHEAKPLQEEQQQPREVAAAKPAQKQSNNILSKVKQSLVKAKKAIIGKSPAAKTVSSDPKDDIKVK